MFLYYYYRLMEMVCEHFNMFRILRTRVGYKLINVGMFRVPNLLSKKKNDNRVIVEVQPSELYLSIDFLKDNYSLLGYNIVDSPHYGLMVALSKGDPINNTDYIRRYIKGTLDGRYPHTRRRLEYFYEKFNFMKKKVEFGDIEPISVFKVGDKYYIKDGKHRAALCAYYNKPIKCSVLDNSNMFGTIGKIVLSLIATNKDYSKHIALYELLKSLQ